MRNHHPTLHCERDVFDGTNFKALLEKALGQLPKQEQKDILSAAGYIMVRCVDADEQPDVGIVDEDAYFRGLSQHSLPLFLNQYPKVKCQRSRGTIALKPKAKKRNETEASFELPPRTDFNFHAEERQEWEENGDLLGRLLFKDIIVDPPQGDLRYGIGDFIINDREIIRLAVHSGFNTEEHNNAGGISSPYVYISDRRGTGSSMHLEDADLASANENTDGSPKVWLIIPPRGRTMFENLCRTELGLKCRCSQFVRHANLFFAPEYLKARRIPHEVVVQMPGDIVVTTPGAYHQVLNQGPNVAVAVNMTLDLPGLGADSPASKNPHKYIYCFNGCGHTEKDEHGKLTEDNLFTEKVWKMLVACRSRADLALEVAWEVEGRNEHADMSQRSSDDPGKTPSRSNGGRDNRLTKEQMQDFELMGGVARVLQLAHDRLRAEETAVPYSPPATPPSSSSATPRPADSPQDRDAIAADADRSIAVAEQSSSITPRASNKRPAPVDSDSGRGKKKTKTTNTTKRPPKTLPPPLAFKAALRNLSCLVEAYTEHQQKKSAAADPSSLGSSATVSHAALLVRGQATAEDVTTALAEDERETVLSQFARRVLKMHFAMLYEERVKQAKADRGNNSTRAVKGEQAPKGTMPKFMASLAVGEAMHGKLDKTTMGQWLKVGKKLLSLAGQRWEGRWMLALRNADGWDKGFCVGEWTGGWEDSARMRLLREVAVEFVGVFERQGAVGAEALAKMEELLGGS